MDRPEDRAQGDERTSRHVRRAQEGDDRSLEWVVVRFTPLLVAQARWRMGPRLAARCEPEDVVNDVWLRTLPRLAGLPAREGRFTPVLLRFLSTAVVHRVQNLRKKLLRAEGDPEPLAEDDATPRADPVTTGVVTRAVRSEAKEMLLRALDGMEEKDREILMRRGIEQQAGADVAAELGIPLATVHVRYHRALRRLREALPGTAFDELPD